jgi:hypothetical protein
MHLNILSDRQNELLSFISGFRRNYYLVGGTAIALHIGHRRSIDYDLFTAKTLNKSLTKRKIFEQKFSKQLLYEDIDQMHFLLNDVKITFFNYPYPIKHDEMVKRFISMPSLITLSAMKAFALGRRAKWKDYVDLYFIFKDYYSIKDISTEANLIFGDLFSEKLFREQMAFHKDIDYSEPVEYLPGFEVKENEIKTFLINKSLESL